MKYVVFLSEPTVGSSSESVWQILTGQDQFALFRKSCTLVDPEASFAIITDFATSFENIPDDTEIIRYDIDQSEIMLERSRRQLDFVERYDFSAPLVFADADMLVLKNFENLFLEPFDVAVTLRPSKEMPINGGLILVNNLRKEVSRQFFHRLVKKMEDETQKRRREWYGDQFALAELLGPLEGKEDIGRIREYDGIAVCYLDSQTFNFSPPSEHPSLFQDLSDIIIYHFKGRCRTYMEAIWRLQVDPTTANARLRKPWLFVEAIKLELSRRRHKKFYRTDTRRKFSLGD